MKCAFVDTTVLCDALLKGGEARQRARAALRRYQHTELPVYAIKEFKAGPLQKFVWTHNTLVTVGSFHRTVQALQRLSLGPQRYGTAGALEALVKAACVVGKSTLDQLTAMYGGAASIDFVLRDRYRLHIQRTVMKGWKERRTIVSSVVQPLECYPEDDVMMDPRGCMSSGNLTCPGKQECCLGPRLRARPADLQKVYLAVPKESGRREDQARAAVLRDLIRTPKREVSKKACRNLGDAYFALFAPDGAEILTTNVRDHKPLAEALGKAVADARADD